MRKILRASVLVLALCGPVFAGDALCPPVAPPPPATAVQGPTTGGEMETTDGQIEPGATATFVEVVLNLLALA
jgi:hypothetical protein